MMHGSRHGKTRMHWMQTYGNWYGTIWMILFWILLIGIVVYLITKIIKNSTKKKLGPPEEQKLSSAPLLILQERLAKGEIDEAQYERLRGIIKEEDE